MGLGASTHPQLLMEKDGRRKYLDQLTCGRQLGIWEKALRLSIRLFQDEKRWINATGDRIVDIKGSKSVSFRWNRERFPGVAKEIAEEIIRNAVWCGEKVFWFSVTSEGEQTVIKPVDYYFYSGIGGIAVFFRRLCAVYPEYGEVSSTLEQMLFSYADKISNREKEPDTQYTGMYCGEGSKIRSGIWEQRVSDERTGNWADLRKKGEEVYRTFAWCNGALGALYARIWAAKWNPEEEWVKEISEYLDDAKMREQVAIFHDVLLSELEKERMPKIVQEKYNM